MSLTGGTIQTHLKIFLEWFNEAIVKKLSPNYQKEITADIKDVLAEKMEVNFMISNVSRTFMEALEASEMKGKLAGKREGILAGKREGILESKLKAAENMLTEGMDEKFIAKILEFDVEKIRELKNKRMN